MMSIIGKIDQANPYKRKLCERIHVGKDLEQDNLILIKDKVW